MPVPLLLMVRELGIGGAERDLTKLAIGLDRRRFRVHVGCFVKDGLRAHDLIEAAVPIVQFPIRSFKSMSTLAGVWKMRRYIREHGVRLVHTFDTPTDIFGVPAAKLAGVPVLSSQLWTSSALGATERLLVRMANRMASGVVVNSDAVRRALISDEGYSSDHLFLNHNGVETDVFYPASDSQPRRPIVVGTVCALRSEKRLDLLMRSFGRLRSVRSGVQLLIVGSGPEENALRRLHRELALGADCRMVPRQRDVAPWLREIDIFVLCSETESFPNALLEAMACGCAVIGSRVGGVPELVAEGTGLLFDAGDEEGLARLLEKLIIDDELRQRFGAAAAQRARNEFSMEKVVQRMQGLYQRIIESGPDPVAGVG